MKSLFHIIKRKLFPELRILQKNINWDEFADHISKSTISPKCKIYSPFNLQEVIIGEYSYIEKNSYISMSNIGKFCSIGPNFMCGWGIHPTNGLSTSPSFYSTNKPNGFSLSKNNKIKERLEINIGNDVFIGMNVLVLDGISIGDGAIIGAGSVVSKNIPPYAVAVGSPIQIIKYRFNEEQIKCLQKIKWWNFSEGRLQDVEKMFYDIESFIKKYDI